MSNLSLIQPALLSKMNERQVLRTIQARGPLSRAEVARHSGISAPTASKAVEALLRSGLLEEGDAPEIARGRPARKLRLAVETAQVLGLVIDAGKCRVISAGLDGKLHENGPPEFDTPTTYEELIEISVRQSQQMMARSTVATHGMAISVPGLIDYTQNRGLLSPNVPITNQHSPMLDISERLGIPCIMVQEAHALCLAERHFGLAKGMDNFAMLDISTGVGLGVMSGGRLLAGHSGLAGEVGHITVDINGRLCGCGNYGCLETVASDSALAWLLSQRLERKVGVEEAMQMIKAREIDAVPEIHQVCHYLALGLAAVINLFNPSTLFVHGRIFETDAGLFDRLIAETGKRALAPSYADCKIVQARGSKRQGAIAAIIEHLTNAGLPSLAMDTVYYEAVVG